MPVHGHPLRKSDATLKGMLETMVKDATTAALIDFSQQPRENGALLGRKYDPQEVITNAMKDFGVGIAKTFHGDSDHDDWLARNQKLVGKPTTKVTLKRTGEVMDAQTFFPSKKTHRQLNNHLKPISLDDSDESELKMAAATAALPRGARYFPDHYPQLHPGLSTSTSSGVAAAAVSPMPGGSGARTASAVAPRASVLPEVIEIDQFPATSALPSAGDVKDMWNRMLDRSVNATGIVRQVVNVEDDTAAEMTTDPYATQPTNDLLENHGVALALIDRLQTQVPDVLSQEMCEMYDGIRRDCYRRPS